MLQCNAMYYGVMRGKRINGVGVGMKKIVVRRRIIELE